MDWLVLRLYRQSVAKCQGIGTDLSNWITLYAELLKPDKELRNMIRQQKQEARAMKERLARFDAAIADQKAAVQRILREMDNK